MEAILMRKLQVEREKAASQDLIITKFDNMLLQSLSLQYRKMVLFCCFLYSSDCLYLSFKNGCQKYSPPPPPPPTSATLKKKEREMAKKLRIVQFHSSFVCLEEGRRKIAFVWSCLITMKTGRFIIHNHMGSTPKYSECQ